MGGIFSNEEQYKPKYNPHKYTKICPGRNTYKIHGKKVYWRGNIVDGANGNKFLNLTNGYGKDDNHIFYRGFIKE